MNTIYSKMTIATTMGGTLRKLSPLSRLSVATLVTMLGATACGTTPVKEESSDTSLDALIGGAPANAHIFDAIGTIYGPDAKTGAPKLFCTATLIAPDRILTNPNCFLGIDGPSSVKGKKHTFRLGANSMAPTASIEISGWTNMYALEGQPLAASDSGGALAIGILSKPVTNVTPLPIGQFKASDLNKTFALVGFGDQSDRPMLDPTQDASVLPPAKAGERRIGSMTLQAREGGHYWAVQYPTFEAYLADAAKYDGDPNLAKDPAYKAEQLAEWNKPLTDADAVLGGKPCDASATGADTGAPILGRVNGKLTVLAVAAKWRYLGPRPKPFNPFLMPLSAAAIGVDARHFIASRAACGLVSSRGDCVGETIVRCGDSNEGSPKLFKNDCATVGLFCAQPPIFRDGYPEVPLSCNPGCTTNAECSSLFKGGTCNAGKCVWPATASF